MTRQRTTRNLPLVQRKNVKAAFENHADIQRLTRDLHHAYNQRHKVIMRIFDELETNPSSYSHLTRKGKTRAKHLEPMTRTLVRKLRAQYQRAHRPLTISGPGCDSPPACAQKPNCICVFGAGPVCCYICLDIAVVQCDF